MAGRRGRVPRWRWRCLQRSLGRATGLGVSFATVVVGRRRRGQGEDIPRGRRRAGRRLQRARRSRLLEPELLGWRRVRSRRGRWARVARGWARSRGQVERSVLNVPAARHGRSRRVWAPGAAEEAPRGRFRPTWLTRVWRGATRPLRRAASRDPSRCLPRSADCDARWRRALRVQRLGASRQLLRPLRCRVLRGRSRLGTSRRLLRLLRPLALSSWVPAWWQVSCSRPTLARLTTGLSTSS